MQKPIYVCGWLKILLGKDPTVGQWLRMDSLVVVSMQLSDLMPWQVMIYHYHKSTTYF